MIIIATYLKTVKRKHCINLSLFFHYCEIARGEAMEALTYAYYDLGW